MDVKEKIKRVNKVLPELTRCLESCTLCPRNCGVNRIKGEKGFCLSGSRPVVFSASCHRGEEPPLSGDKGSGTIFFSHCNMRCVYCQNYTFSQTSSGRIVSAEDLGDIMLSLQDKGAHNINLVSPTHFVPGIVEALKHAWIKGLQVPIVYNTGGYDSSGVIKLLDGLIDIYLPDMRYSSDHAAEKYSQAKGYVQNNRNIVLKMHRQVGALKIHKGLAKKGLIIRLLILPGGISGTEETMEFIAENLGRDVSLSVMSQYYPAFKASSYCEISRPIGREEYDLVMKKMEELGLVNGWVQPLGGRFEEKFAGENFEENI